MWAFKGGLLSIGFKCLGFYGWGFMIWAFGKGWAFKGRLSMAGLL